MGSEADIQALVHKYPVCLPIAEIDAMFSTPVAICTELNTPAGPIDNFMVRHPACRCLLNASSGATPRGGARCSTSSKVKGSTPFVAGWPPEYAGRCA